MRSSIARCSSLDLGIYKLLLEYGWKPDMIGSLFIESVNSQIEPGDGATRTFRNDLSHWADYSAFHAWLSGNLVGDNRLQVCEGPDPTTFGPPINIAPTPGRSRCLRHRQIAVAVRASAAHR
jgi:hypothetical protein